MKQFKFVTSYQEGIWEYHFCPKVYERIISENEGITSNEIILSKYKGEMNYYDIYESYNISPYTSSENDLLYILLIWEIAKMNTMLGLVSRETDYLKCNFKKNPSLVNWEYRLEHKLNSLNKYSKRIIGYTNPDVKPCKSDFNSTPLNKAGLFEIEAFQELIDFFKTTVDIHKLVNIYSFKDSKSSISKLQRDTKPTIRELLKVEDVFIGLSIGGELGYQDYLLIKSKRDLKEFLNPILKRINGFAKEYKSNIQNVKSLREAVKLIDEKLEKYDLRENSS